MRHQNIQFGYFIRKQCVGNGECAIEGARARTHGKGAPTAHACALILAAAVSLFFLACGGGSASIISSPPKTTTYTISGTVSGLSTARLNLQDNAADELLVTANGPFTFAKPIASGGGYNVTILVEPSSLQFCQVTNGSGTANANVTSVAVTLLLRWSGGCTRSADRRMAILPRRS